MLADEDSDTFFVGLIVACILAAIGGVFVYYRAEKRFRLIQDTPTSKTKGVFIGLNELKGNIELTDKLVGYLSDEPCCWYNFKISEHYIRTRTTTDSEGNTKTETYSGWESVDNGSACVPFKLVDDTGELRIDPRRAEIDGDPSVDVYATPSDSIYYDKGPRHAISGSTDKRHFEETFLCNDEDVYILGSAKIRSEVAEYEIAYDKNDEIYLISTRKESEVQSGYATARWLGIVVGLIGVAATPFCIEYFTKLFLSSWILSIIGSLAYVGILFCLYATLVFNGLIQIRARLVRAWSLIEIQLQRRFDLIPQLVESVKEYLDHESNLTTLLANARTNKTAAGKLPTSGDVDRQVSATNAQTAVLHQLMVVQESYPDLKGSELVTRLMTELTDTEDRIALSKEFYNGSGANYNTRTKRFPEVIFSRLLGFKSARYYEIEDFVKAVPAVDLSRDS